MTSTICYLAMLANLTQRCRFKTVFKAKMSRLCPEAVNNATKYPDMMVFSRGKKSGFGFSCSLNERAHLVTLSLSTTTHTETLKLKVKLRGLGYVTGHLRLMLTLQSLTRLRPCVKRATIHLLDNVSVRRQPSLHFFPWWV